MTVEIHTTIGEVRHHLTSCCCSNDHGNDHHHHHLNHEEPYEQGGEHTHDLLAPGWGQY